MRTANAEGSLAPPQTTESPQRRVRPIVAWALAGLVFLTIQITAYAGWIISGDARRVPTGDTPVPTYMTVTARLFRSYYTHGFCGPGTAFACSGPGVPIPRPDSAHLGPDGTWSVSLVPG